MAFKKKEQISFFLTTNCNLGCVYCYMPKMQVDEEDRVIDIEFCAEGLKDFFSSSKSRCIRFFGSGEPTLAFDTMKKIKDIAYELAGESLTVELETNGYFEDDIANWISDNVDYLWISCDGSSNIQNNQRPCLFNKNSSEIVHKNINRFAKDKEMQFGVRATIHENDFCNQISLIDFFKNLGVKYVCASPMYASKPNPAIKTPNLLDFAKGFIPAFNYALENNMFYQTLFMVNFDEETDIYCQASIPCPRLTTDGYVSCCDWASFGSKYFPGSLQECIYGYYDKITKKIKYLDDKVLHIKQRNVNYLGEGSCYKCRALKHCAGGCIGKVMSQTNSMFLMYKPWCEAVLYLFDNLVIPNKKIPVLHP